MLINFGSAWGPLETVTTLQHPFRQHRRLGKVHPANTNRHRKGSHLVIRNRALGVGINKIGNFVSG